MQFKSNTTTGNQLNLEMKEVSDEILSTTKSLVSGLSKKIDTVTEELLEHKQRTQTRMDDIQVELGRPSMPGMYGSQGNPSEEWLAKSVWDSAEFQAFARTGRGRIGIPIEAKTAITSAAVGSSTPGILTPGRVDGIVKPGVRRLRVRDILPTFKTEHNSVEYVKENVFTNNSSPQVEGSDKAESALTFTINYANVHTLAHWVPATRQVLQDFAQLQAYIGGRLIDGLRDREDLELLTGDGLGQHFTGLVTSATAYNTGYNVALDTRLDTLNHAIYQLSALEYVADGIIMNPYDWRKLQLLKTEEGGVNKGVYIVGSPTSDAQTSVWGLPVAVTTAMPSGKFLVGAFKIACAIHDRMDAVVEVSDSHSDYFVKNLLALRCESRLALTVQNSAALVYGSFV